MGNPTKEQKRHFKKPYHCLGFDFYSSEMAAMRRAKEAAVKFMKEYGKGQQPLLSGHPMTRRSEIKKAKKWTPFDL